MEFLKNVPLAKYTVFQVGGPARFFCEAKCKEEIIQALVRAQDKNLPYFLLGLGSNILVSDRGFPGLVIKLENNSIYREGNYIFAQAGAKMAEVVNFSLTEGLGGFEWAIGVPGTIGGSVRGNAGCFGSQMKDAVESVEVFDADSVSNHELSSAECDFSYRHSVFKERPELVVLSATLKLKPGDSKESQRILKEYTQKRVTSQDIGAKTAGCVFKNPSPDAPAALLIDQAGLKGTKVGGAMISQRHANFIINTGNATAEDIVMLIGLIKERIHRKFNVLLEEEIQYVGF